MELINYTIPTEEELTWLDDRIYEISITINSLGGDVDEYIKQWNRPN